MQDVVANASEHGTPHTSLTATSQHHQLYARLLSDLHDVVTRVVPVFVHELEVDLQSQRLIETRKFATNLDHPNAVACFKQLRSFDLDF